jgi:hypothetical protein
MYLADIEYHYYEARLTREMQEEGLAATLASLGLTTASTLVAPAETKTILSGIATAVIGADKAYNEKELLSNTIQALQTQMRADRKTQAALIYAKMYKDAGNNTKVLTPIYEYTLPMALSDAETYYQAGTIASALIGLSKTLANAEQNADQAKCEHGPNLVAVCDVRSVAAPNLSMPPIDFSMPIVGAPNRNFGRNSGGNPSGGVIGNPGGNLGRNPGSIPTKPSHSASNKSTNDARQACQQLPNNAVRSQEAICNFIDDDPVKITKVNSALQNALQKNPQALPPSTGLAAVIRGTDPPFEIIRGIMLKDPLMN